MADHKVERLGGKTLLQYADTPYMDMLAKKGRCGRLLTVPDGYQPGSEVANTAIMGYDLDKVYEGRGPLEAASIGYEMQPGDNPPVGILLCTRKGKKMVEYALAGMDNHLFVSTYMLQLPDKKTLEDFLLKQMGE